MAPVLLARDARVPLIERDTLASLANSLRRSAGFSELEQIDVGRLINFFLANDITRKGHLTIDENANPKVGEAYVTYEPLVLHITRANLILARLGRARERCIVAHEIGHIVLHDKHARPFAVDPVKKNIFSDWRLSAEWQATTFSSYLLVPDAVLIDCESIEQIAYSCRVTIDMATERFALRGAARKKLRVYDGDICPNCHSSSLVYRGAYQKCDLCDHVVEFDF